MNNQSIFLVCEEKRVNEYGDIESVRTMREVFVSVKSVGMNEFYQANALGFKPEVKFVLADVLDYNDEKIILFQDFGRNLEEFSVVRTYRTGNALEIVCKRGVD